MPIPEGFTLERESEIPELKTLARLYRHEKTGAQILSLINDDENKSFGISFRTPPDDSTGVAHILEHGVLAGSKKYPVKEPFVELIKGSLNTFLNAMTFPDKTVYPVASTNLKDYYNLVDVYLDAVFNPLIPPHILEQEGWHYDLESPDGQLEYKGIVFNEMKGAYSSPDSRLSDLSQRVVFPDNTYGFDSGGDPKNIPDLTYEQYKAFHERFYHPSNSLVYFYGDDDPDKRLDLIAEYLDAYSAADVDAHVTLQPEFDEARRHTFKYPGGEDGDLAKKSMLTVNWMLPESDTLEEAFACDILSHVLLGTQASPLRKALIDSGLGENVTGGGLDDYTRQPTFSVGLKGIDSSDAGAVENLVVSALEGLAENGIDADTVEASLNTIEFRLRENNTGSFPKGLVLLFVALGNWTYGKDPIEPLFYEAPMQALRKRIESGEPVFEEMIRGYLLENQHRVTVLLEPDPEMNAREEAEERARLDKVQASLTPEQVDEIIARTHELKRLQEAPDSPEDLAKLPFLKLDDLEKENKLVPREEFTEGDVPVLFHDLFTNGIVYFDIGFDLHTLPADLLPYLPMFNRALLGLGTHMEDFVKLTQRIGQKIGGLYPTAYVSPKFSGDEAAAWLFLRGKGTLAQTGDLLAIMNDVLLNVNFDLPERFRQMVYESKASMEAGLIPGGHSIVNTRLRSMFNEAYWLNEQLRGISSLFFLRELANEIEADWSGVVAKLEKIREIVFNRSSMIANVTLDAENWQVFRPQMAAFLEGLPASKAEQQRWPRGDSAGNEGLTIPAQVNYVAKGANLYDHGFSDHGSTLVINKYLQTTYLWEKIRVQGGAYGGMAAWDRFTGVYTYLSYRDPNLLGTLANYDGTPDYLANLEISDDELTKTIIGTIGDVDGYELPDSKGYTDLVRYLVGLSNENRQKMRDEILGTSPSDFGRFGEALRAVREHGNVVVLGSAEAINDANNQRGGDWLDVKKVM